MTLANPEAEAGIICGVLHGRPEEQDRILKALTPVTFTPQHTKTSGQPSKPCRLRGVSSTESLSCPGWQNTATKTTRL